MKGGVALALLGLLAVILGVKGTAGDLWRAATGGGKSSSTTAGSSPAASAAVIPSAASVIPNIGPSPGHPGNPAVQI